jgi:hypothetical protein
MNFGAKKSVLRGEGCGSLSTERQDSYPDESRQRVTGLLRIGKESAAQKRARQAYKKRNIALGLCINHKVPAEPGKTMCKACLPKAWERTKATDELRRQNGLVTLQTRRRRELKGDFGQEIRI